MKTPPDVFERIKKATFGSQKAQIEISEATSSLKTFLRIILELTYFVLNTFDLLNSQLRNPNRWKLKLVADTNIPLNGNKSSKKHKHDFLTPLVSLAHWVLLLKLLIYRSVKTG